VTKLSKRAIIIGGTGFLGYHSTLALLEGGWSVSVLGLPPAPPAGLFPPEVSVILLNVNEASDETLLELLQGYNGLVFAAGADDRATPKGPAQAYFHYANVETSVRMLTLARQAGIKRAAVLGSYFAHFNRIWPELRLAERHPYIRSRVEQEAAVTSIPGIDVVVLELPYIFGKLPIHGWKPLWTPLIKYIRAFPILAYMKGGSACITARTTGQAVLGALEKGAAGSYYPIGDENLTWTELLTRLAAADQRRVRVLSLPAWLINIGLYGMWLTQQVRGLEAGLDLRFFNRLQTAQAFINPSPSQLALGYQTGGLDQALQETVAALSRQ
jgi:dihydroflavonol-4-reductase